MSFSPKKSSRFVKQVRTTNKKSRSHVLFFLVLHCFIFPACAADADSKQVAVVYPAAPPPYNLLYKRLIAGISQQTAQSPLTLQVDETKDFPAIINQIRRSNIRTVIALGRPGIEAARVLPQDLSVVLGGILTLPENQQRYASTLVFTPDPSALFLRAKNLIPKLKRIVTIYDPAKSEWIIQIARESAKNLGLDFRPIAVSSLNEAASKYKGLFGELTPNMDAIWFPPDFGSAEEEILLPVILEEAWDHKIPLISGSARHVKQGALFAMYPDEIESGKTLGNLAESLRQGMTIKRGPSPAKELKSALNLRTAVHLQLGLRRDQLPFVDNFFPEP